MVERKYFSSVAARPTLFHLPFTIYHLCRMSPATRRALVLIVFVAAVLRFVPIWFGLPYPLARPDEEVSIAFNPRYLQDGVSAIPGDSVRIRVIDAFKPSVIDQGTDEAFLYLLMPVRV